MLVTCPNCKVVRTDWMWTVAFGRKDKCPACKVEGLTWIEGIASGAIFK
jgi:hypothetical protein